MKKVITFLLCFAFISASAMAVVNSVHQDKEKVEIVKSVDVLSVGDLGFTNSKELQNSFFVSQNIYQNHVVLTNDLDLKNSDKELFKYGDTVNGFNILYRHFNKPIKNKVWNIEDKYQYVSVKVLEPPLCNLRSELS